MVAPARAVSIDDSWPDVHELVHGIQMVHQAGVVIIEDSPEARSMAIDA